MANEITVGIQLDVNKDPLVDQIRKTGVRYDMTNARKSGGIQTIGTSAELVAISSDLTEKGYAFFRNNDETNFIVLSTETDGTLPFCKLLPGEMALLPLGSGVIYALADTASCPLEYMVYDR